MSLLAPPSHNFPVSFNLIFKTLSRGYLMSQQVAEIYFIRLEKVVLVHLKLCVIGTIVVF